MRTWPRRMIQGLLLATIALGGAGGQQIDDQPAGANPAIRFEPIGVYLETGAAPLAAYQVEVFSPAGRVAIVGIEGGEHERFAQPPYYDPAAMRHDRVVIGAFSTAPASRLPAGTVHVATIHVQIEGAGEVEIESRLHVAATVNGVAIDVRVRLVREPKS